MIFKANCFSSSAAAQVLDLEIHLNWGPFPKQLQAHLFELEQISLVVGCVVWWTVHYSLCFCLQLLAGRRRSQDESDSEEQQEEDVQLEEDAVNEDKHEEQKTGDEQDEKIEMQDEKIEMPLFQRLPLPTPATDIAT